MEASYIIISLIVGELINETVEKNGTIIYNCTYNYDLYGNITQVDASDIIAGVTFTSGSSVNYTQTITLADPTRTGFTFNYWTINGTQSGTDNGTTTSFTKLAGQTGNTDEVTITANWTENTYNVTVNVGEG